MASTTNHDGYREPPGPDPSPLNYCIISIALATDHIRYGRTVARTAQAGLDLCKVSVVSIIDDDEDVRVATENLIQSYGLDAIAFSSAEAFLESSALTQCACLVTDVQMPGMSGIELQRKLLDLGHNVPMIFITAFPEERLRRQVKAAGALGFLSKPFDAEQLMASIDRALSRDAGKHAR